MNMYNLTTIEPQFKDWLLAENISSVTVRNYLSDYRFFIGWYLSVHISENLFELSFSLLQQYKDFLILSELPIKTINRRLSTVRKLCSCLRDLDITSNYPEKALSNVCEQELDVSSNNDNKRRIVAEFQYEVLLNSSTNAHIEEITTTLYELLDNEDVK